MSKIILIATDKPFAKEAVDMIKAIVDKTPGYELKLLEKYTEQSQLIEAAKEADAMIVRSDKATKEVTDAGDRLRVIVRAGAGYDNIDLEAAKAKGIVAMNTPGQNSNAVAELAIGMMIYMARGKFNGKSGSELKGKTLGIHAYGNVGRYVATIAKGFGMDIYAFDPFIRDEDISKDGVKVVHSVEELYSKCQYVSVHIPANEKTKKSIHKGLLESMPKNAVLVNTARKEVICEEGLKMIFEQRPDFKYLSDIAPDCAEELNEKYADRVYFTPKKMGAQTEEANINAGIAAVEQIIAYFEKGDTKFQVNK
ncbi:MAG: 3-phosphoglycerate dehydrogenase [Candidatus Delongbacteria bacterium]|nr:3-phosphoglycerate dehydrogenase [Candidatus Delongbacteria bacterium]MCG2761049.1 3-phosphoglycerate dehydrogenase [Candidatus Delongbacteria bacterium]